MPSLILTAALEHLRHRRPPLRNRQGAVVAFRCFGGSPAVVIRWMSTECEGGVGGRAAAEQLASVERAYRPV